MPGLTVQAERPGGGYVAVKSLSLRSMSDWKQLELFENEAATMRKLKHSGIPAYLDYFEVDSEGDRGYFLVQVPCCLCLCKSCFCSAITCRHHA